jgi:hypothetical protein
LSSEIAIPYSWYPWISMRPLSGKTSIHGTLGQGGVSNMRV